MQIYKQQQANIGYTASSERRYFKGVQRDTERKGEIFGLSNIFKYHSDSGLLQNIVNKTNVAEAKAGVSLVDVDMEEAAKDSQDLSAVKEEPKDDEDDMGMSQLAAILTVENPEKMLDSKNLAQPKKDVIQAILSAAGVEYTHDNAEVVGSSKVEEQLSRKAARGAFKNPGEGQSILFAGSQDGVDLSLNTQYNPPEDVQRRQFCEMAREFGFANATEFALVVESWTNEARRSCLDTFYKRRASKLRDGAMDDEGADTKDGVKSEVKDEDVKSGFKTEDEEDFKVVKDEVDDKGILRPEGKDEPDVKDIKAIKIEGGSKRTSIFLSDEDEDDEL